VGVIQIFISRGMQKESYNNEVINVYTMSAFMFFVFGDERDHSYDK
jgi:hypothetical protein